MTSFLLGLAFVGFVFWSLMWIYRDAEKRGTNGVLMAALAFLAWPIGFLIWWAARPKPLLPLKDLSAPASCARCGYTIPAHMAACPNCQALRMQD